MAIEVTGNNAASLGAMLSDAILKDLADAGEAKIKLKNGPARMLQELKELYGENVLLHFPKPGSLRKDYGTNVLTDIGPWGEEGKQTSWYKVYYEGSKRGRMLVEQMTKHNEAKETFSTVAAWERDKAAIGQRMTTEIARLKDAIKLNIQLVNVNSQTEVTAVIDMEDGQVVRSNKCIFLRNQDMTKFKQVTIGEFLAIKVDQAMNAKGGATWDNVMATTKKKPKDLAAGYRVTKPVEFDTSIAAIGSYLTHIQEMGNEREYRSLLAHLNEAGSDYLLLSMDNLYSKLENYLELPSIKTRLQQLQEDGGLKAIEAVRNQHAKHQAA